MICERVLEDEGVYGDVTLGEYHLDIMPMEDDLFSLELENSFRELYLVGHGPNEEAPRQTLPT